jgi:hypothetical protein
VGQGWLKEGIKEIRKELSEWPEWKRTTAVRQGATNVKHTSPSENSQTTTGVKKK